MKIKPGPLTQAAIPMLRGIAQLRITAHGVVAQKWPSPKRRPLTPAEIWYREQFARAGRMASMPIWQELITAQEMTKGTTMVPRDFLTSAIYGRAYEVMDPDGTVWEVTSKGPPTEATDVPQQWMMSLFDDAYNAAASTSSYAWKGTAITVLEEIKIRGLAAIFTPVIGGQYQMCVGTVGPGNTVGEIGFSDIWTATDNSRLLRRFQIQVDVPAFTKIFIMIGRTDTAGNVALNAYFSATAKFAFPMQANSWCRTTQQPPAPGGSLDVSGNASPPLGLLLQWEP